MKTPTFKYAGFLSLVASLACATVSRAQDDEVEIAPRVTETTRTTETTTSGAFGEFSDDHITVRTETSGDPVQYSFSKTTTWVDESGAEVSRESVKSGVPLTVHYTRTPEGMVAKKVVVRKTTTTPEGSSRTTTTTTTTGTVGEFGKDQIVVRTESSKEPLRYRFSKTTTYVDEAGNPVSVETIKSGAPVRIEFTKTEEGPVAKKVIVKKTTTTPGRVTKTTKTKTTTSNGTYSETAGDALVIRTEASEPVRYRFTKTTTYVDETGEPVSIETVKSGAPISVEYTQDGDSLVAERVIVRTTTTTRRE